MGVASLVLGIVSIVSAVFGLGIPVGVICGAVGIVLGILGKNLHSAAKSAAQIVMKVFQFPTILIKCFLKKLHYKARGGES